MRGPGLKIELDTRRLWKCGLCGYEMRLAADRSTSRCGCRPEAPFMKLVNEKIPFVRRPWAPHETPEEADAAFRDSNTDLLSALERATPGPQSRQRARRPDRSQHREPEGATREEQLHREDRATPPSDNATSTRRDEETKMVANVPPEDVPSTFEGPTRVIPSTGSSNHQDEFGIGIE